MRWLLPLAAVLLLSAPALAGPLPDRAGTDDCWAGIDPTARFGPQVKASCHTDDGRGCAVRFGPGPTDAPELSHDCHYKPQ
ncbi:MAG: hypothetical protein ACPGQL_07925 [Thermoplasmatota archaeon]